MRGHELEKAENLGVKREYHALRRSKKVRSKGRAKKIENGGASINSFKKMSVRCSQTGKNLDAEEEGRKHRPG